MRSIISASTHKLAPTRPKFEYAQRIDGLADIQNQQTRPDQNRSGKRMLSNRFTTRPAQLLTGSNSPPTAEIEEAEMPAV